MVRSVRTLAAASLALSCAASAHAQSTTTHVVDFFPELPQVNHISQLRFIGPQSGTVTGARLFIEFTTSNGFNAADLTVALVAPVPASPGFGGWFISGADLEWSGEGTFTAVLSTTDLNGDIAGGLWGFELGALLDPPAYSGSFSESTRFEIDISTGCVADFNGVGGVGVQDIYDFLSAWSAGEDAANINGDAGVTVQDVYDFLEIWVTGCP